VFEAKYEIDFLVRLFSSGQKSLFTRMSKIFTENLNEFCECAER